MYVQFKTTRLQFIVTEAKLVTCSKCQNLFNFDKQPGAAAGAVKCPRCKATVNEKGRLVGKQEDAQKIRTFKAAKWRDPNSPGRCGVLCAGCGECDKERQTGKSELDTAVRSYVLGYFARLHG